VKTVYIKDVHEMKNDQPVEILGWVKHIRKHKAMVFIDLMDSTGLIQVVVNKSEVSLSAFNATLLINREAAIKVCGFFRGVGVKAAEVAARTIEIVGDVKDGALNPRNDINIFNPDRADHLMRNRHLYIRNPKVMAILKYRHLLMGGVHQFFRDNGFTEITAPILTPLPLYDDGTAINLDLHGQNVFLTQCVGYYLESAAHAFERVYNIGPSFRGEESRSKRHLMEYWHIKAELLWSTLEEGMDLIEVLMQFLVTHCMENQDAVTGWLGTEFNDDALKAPFPRASYKEVVGILSRHGYDFPFGKSLGHEEEAFLSRHFDAPVWVVGVPRSVEPFPYVIDPEDPILTRTADLIGSRGYGELLGVAEKITDVEMLTERMTEKGKAGKSDYDWLVELREMGCVPHIGFGLGVERFLRWMLQYEHVRDGIPFPRTFKRRIYP
jgi:asparaginyl-tRNA synthetase